MKRKKGERKDHSKEKVEKKRSRNMKEDEGREGKADDN